MNQKGHLQLHRELFEQRQKEAELRRSPRERGDASGERTSATGDERKTPEPANAKKRRVS